MKHKKHKNLTFFFLSLVLAYFLSTSESFQQFLLDLGRFGYISTFIAGMLYTSMFTIATGAVMLVILSEHFSLIELALVAGLGSVFSDYLIFKYVKSSLTYEIEDLYKKYGGNHLSHMLHSKYFSWTLPVIGALIIASPFPDEFGISLMGLTQIKTYKFILIAFILDVLGIVAIVSASSFIQP